MLSDPKNWLPMPPKHKLGASPQDWHTRQLSTRQLRLWDWIIPPFQRDWKWSPERMVEYMNSVLRGEPQSPFVAWHPSGQEKVYCLDGQHRLASLGVVFEGREPCPEIHFDVERCEWVVGPADDLLKLSIQRIFTPAGQSRAWWYSLPGVLHDPIMDRLNLVYGRMNIEQSVLVSNLEETQLTWEQAADFFDRMANAVPFTDEERLAMRKYVRGLRASS